MALNLNRLIVSAPFFIYISRRNDKVGHVKFLDIFAYVIYLTFRELRHLVTACFLYDVLVCVSCIVLWLRWLFT